MTPQLLDRARLAAFMGLPADDTVSYACELTEDLIAAEAGPYAITDPPQPGLRPVAFAVATRLLGAPPGVLTESTGQVSMTYAGQAGQLTLTKDEQAAVHRALGKAGANAIRSTEMVNPNLATATGAPGIQIARRNNRARS